MFMRYIILCALFFSFFGCKTSNKPDPLPEIFDACKNEFVSTAGNKLTFDTTLKDLRAGEEIVVHIFKTPNTPHTYLMASGSWGDSYAGNWSGAIHNGLEIASVVIRVPDGINSKTDSINIGTSAAFKDPVTIRGLYIARYIKPHSYYPDYIFYPLLYDFLYEYSSKPAYINKDSLSHYLSENSCIKYCEARHISPTKLIETYKHLSSTLYKHTSIWDQLAKRSNSLKIMSQSTTYEANEMDTLLLAATASEYILFPDDTLRLHITNKTGQPFSLETWQSSVTYNHKKISTTKNCKDSLISIPCNILPKGFLIIKLIGRNQNVFEVPVIVNRKKNAGVVILAPSATWMAYNAYEGKSLYRNIIDKEPVYLASYHKPLTSVYFKPLYGKHDFVIVQNIYDWFDSAYGAVIIPDHYLQHKPQLLLQAQTIIPAYHCEYFSVEMYNTLKNLGATRNLLSIGANQVYWRIEWIDNKTYECHKDATLFNNNMLIGGHWSGVLESEASLLGSAYCGMVEAAPYQVINAGHFLFNGCAVKEGDIFGKKGIDGLPICGDETDKLNRFSPKNAVVLAKGTNLNNLGGEIVYFQRGKYGSLNTSAITSGAGLGIDPVFTKLISNFMKIHHKTQGSLYN